MSSDLFLTNQPPEQQADIQKAIGMVFGVASLFFVGQFLGAVFGIVLLQLSGTEADMVAELVRNDVFAQLLFSSLIAAVTICGVYIFARLVFQKTCGKKCY